MRDLVAALVALALLAAALSLATTLHFWRRRRERAHKSEREAGRTIVAEIPVGDELRLFTEDEHAFHYGQEVIDKDDVRTVRVLINGAPLAVVKRNRAVSDISAFANAERGGGVLAEQDRGAGPPGVIFEDRPEGIARDRWDVAIETPGRTVLVECGAIRERISQELARAVFEAVKRDLERRDART
jgi:hypothetical protein